MKSSDIIGTKFNLLTPVELIRVGDNHKKYYLCLCDCGNKKEILSNSFTSGKTKSCGCLQKIIAKSLAKNSLTKHGLTGTCEYNIWNSMKSRCYNSQNNAYERYGGRGIKVCNEWRCDFNNFINDMGFRPSKQHSIERLDNNGNYEPSNCVWATINQQSNNKSNNAYYEFDGIRLTISQWAAKFGIKKNILHQYLRGKNRNAHTIYKAICKYSSMPGNGVFCSAKND